MPVRPEGKGGQKYGAKPHHREVEGRVTRHRSDSTVVARPGGPKQWTLHRDRVPATAILAMNIGLGRSTPNGCEAFGIPGEFAFRPVGNIA